MSADPRGPLGAESFSWDDLEEAPSHEIPPQEERTTGATRRPSDARPQSIGTGRPTALGVDRRTPELREADILAHRDRIDAARAQGLMVTEEALDAPRDWI